MRPLAVASTFAFVLATSLAVPGVASAQGAPTPISAPDGDAARADALFEEGRALMASGDHAAACPKLEESQRIRPGIGTLFNLADCHEKTGQLVLAYREFTEVAERTKVALQADREKIARERLAALEAKVPVVIVTLPDDLEDATILLDGTELPPSQMGVPQPLEPGEHVITATAPGDEPVEQRFTVAAGDPPLALALGDRSGSTDDGDAGASGGKRNVGLIVTGSILMGVGLIGAAVGSWQIDQGRESVGIGTGLGGLACIGVGVPLFIIGLKKRPVDGAPGAPPAGDAKAALVPVDPMDGIEAGPIPAITVGALGPGSASAAWRF